MPQFVVDSRYKLSPGQRQKQKSAHPASSLRISACAILTTLKGDKGDLRIVRLDLDDGLKVAWESLSRGGIVHSNREHPRKFAIAILCTVSSRTAEF